MTQPTAAPGVLALASSSCSTTVSKPEKRRRAGSFWNRRRSSASTSTCSSHSESSGPASAPRHKKSLLRRLSWRRSTGSAHTHHHHSSSKGQTPMEEITELLDETRREPPAQVQHLDQRGLEELAAGQAELALNTWEEALALVTDQPHHAFIATKLQCQLISLYLQLHEEQQLQSNYDAAKELVSQLNTDIVLEEPHCWTPTKTLQQILVDMGLWEVALSVATHLETSSLTVARLHLEVALQQHPQTLVLSHLSECHQRLLALTSDQQQQQHHKERLSAAWRDLAEAYVAQGDAAELALACAQSRFQLLTTPQERALAHYDLALQIYCPLGRYDAALREVEKGLQALELLVAKDEGQDTSISAAKALIEDSATTTTLALKLSHCKGDILCRLDRWKESLQEYERVVEGYLVSPHHGPADAANVLYIMGKVCTHAKHYTAALTYLERELQMTRTVVGPHHLAVSKILHELAKVAELGLNDYPRAIQYYQEALMVESKVFQTCRRLTMAEQPSPIKQSSSNGSSSKASFYTKKMQVSDLPVTTDDKLSSASTGSSNKQTQVQSQMLMQDAKTAMVETKRCLGKLHFKMGDFDKALRTTLTGE